MKRKKNTTTRQTVYNFWKCYFALRNVRSHTKLCVTFRIVCRPPTYLYNNNTNFLYMEEVTSDCSVCMERHINIRFYLGTS